MILIFSAWLGLSAGAARTAPSQCGTVFNLPEFLQTPHDQGNLGWCYAYAAADLASAYQGEPVSAADIAINYNYAVAISKPKVKRRLTPRIDRSATDNFQGLPAGGDPTDALTEVIGGGAGFCPEKDFPSDVLTRIVPNPAKRKTELEKSHLEDRLESVIALTRPDAHPVNCPSSTFPNMDVWQISDVLHHAKGIAPDPDGSLRLAAVARVNCNGHRLTPKFTTQDLEMGPLSVARLNAVLAKGAVAAVGLTTEDESHALLLAGRFWDPAKKQCNYIFKDNVQDPDHPERQTVPGYSVIPESELKKSAGYVLGVRKPARWKSASMPDLLNAKSSKSP